MHINKLKTGVKRLDFRYFGKRCRVSLGKIPMEVARVHATRVSALISTAGERPSPELADWIARLPDRIRAKLIEIGLVKVDAKYPSGLQKWWEHVLEREYEGIRSDGTYRNYKQSMNRAVKHFGKDFSVKQISKADIEEYRSAMIRSGLAKNTAGGHLRKLKTVLNWAIKYELIDYNPFAAIKIDNKKDREKKVYVPSSTIKKLMMVCDPYWQAAICLSRFAGLRAPSDIFGLEWDRVNFPEETIVAWRQKTQHDNLIPMSDPVKRSLGVLYDNGEPGRYVFTENMRSYIKYPGRARQRLLALIHKSGQEAWPVLWNSMRTSYGRDLADNNVPIQDIAKWLDHSVDVAISNYQLPPEKQMNRVKKLKLD